MSLRAVCDVCGAILEPTDVIAFRLERPGIELRLFILVRGEQGRADLCNGCLIEMIKQSKHSNDRSKGLAEGFADTWRIGTQMQTTLRNILQNIQLNEDDLPIVQNLIEGWDAAMAKITRPT